MTSKPIVLLSVNNEISTLQMLPFCVYSFYLQGFTPYILFNDEGNAHKNNKLVYLVKSTIDKFIPKGGAYFFDVSYKSPIEELPELFTEMANMYLPLLIQEYINDNLFAVISSPDVFAINNFHKRAEDTNDIKQWFYRSIYVGMSIAMWKKVMKYDGRDINEMLLADYKAYRTGFDFSVAGEFAHEVCARKINDYYIGSAIPQPVAKCNDKGSDEVILTPEFNDFSKYYPQANWSWVAEYKDNFVEYAFEHTLT